MMNLTGLAAIQSRARREVFVNTVLYALNGIAPRQEVALGCPPQFHTYTAAWAGNWRQPGFTITWEPPHIWTVELPSIQVYATGESLEDCLKQLNL